MTQLVPVRLLKFRVHTDGSYNLSGFDSCFASSGLSHPHLTTIQDSADDHVNQCTLDVSDMMAVLDVPCNIVAAGSMSVLSCDIVLADKTVLVKLVLRPVISELASEPEPSAHTA